jgi:hypothetical protein
MCKSSKDAHTYIYNTIFLTKVSLPYLPYGDGVSFKLPPEIELCGPCFQKATEKYNELLKELFR